MKKFLGAVVLVVITTAGWAAETDFWTQLTPAERAAAGLDTLTPAQQEKLNALAGRFAREGARQAIEVAKVEAKAEAKAEAVKLVKQQEQARVGLAPAGEEVVASRIAGEFRGWTGQTLFRLENGQTWVQTDKSESNFLPVQPGPEVEIRKSGMGGWKLQILPQGRWVRVKRVN